MGLPCWGCQQATSAGLRSAQAIWAPPQGQGEAGTGCVGLRGGGGGAWCLILNLLAVVGLLALQEVSLHLPLDPSPESGPLSHRFPQDSGKLSMARCTDTLMPHMRVSQLEQGVSTSACHTASCSLAACAGSVLVIQQPGNSRSSVTFAQLLCSPSRPRPARTGTGPVQDAVCPQSPTLLQDH